MDILPTVAIVIPCRNEVNYIRECLHSILAQDYKGSIRVFVSDGRSDDGTREIIREVSSAFPQIVLLDNLKNTTPYALNLGIVNSTEDIVIILGAHAKLMKDYVRLCVERLNSDLSIGCAGGIIENVFENKAAEIISKAMSSPFGVGSAHFRTGLKSGFVDTVAFGAYKREVFEKAGLFDEELARNQDDEFNFRISRHGFRIYLDPAIRSHYFVRGSYSKLYRQYYQYGYWKVYVNVKHRTITTLRQLFPAMFVLFLIPGLLIALLSKFLFIAWLFISALYFCAGFYFASRIAGKPSDIFQMVKTFFILHYSYGLGYIFGMIDFLVKRKKPSVKQQELTR